MKFFFIVIAIAFASGVSIAGEKSQLEKEYYSDSTDLINKENKSIVIVAKNQVLPGEDYAWDEITHRTVTMWQCRSTKTLKVVSRKYCEGKKMIDSTWPDKVPRNYEGRMID